MLRVGAPLVAAFCGGALWGCGGETGEPPVEPVTDIRPVWDKHFAAFREGVRSKDGTAERKAALDDIVKDYDDNSIVTIWDIAKSDAQANVTHEGDAIGNMFKTLLGSLQDCDDFDSKWKLNQPTSSSPGSVFLLWSCAKDGLNKATSTFIFVGDKIRKHNIVIDTGAVSENLLQSAGVSQEPRAADYTPDSVKAAWHNHLVAFRLGADAKDDHSTKVALDKLMLDYTEDSVVHAAFYVGGTIPAVVEHKGLASIRWRYAQIFKDIEKKEDAKGIFFEMSEEKSSGPVDQVFLISKIPASKIVWSTDTFIFDKNLKIIKQNMVVVNAVTDEAGSSGIDMVV